MGEPTAADFSAWKARFLNQEHIQTSPGQEIAGHSTCGTCTYNDCIKNFHQLTASFINEIIISGI
jgi:hypothetical protein